jgi:hypothetical protein
MNLVSNIWDHPKTSIAGLLIGIVTIAGVLSQQGITLGTAGTGTVIALISGIATALLGLLAKDPDDASTSTSTTSTAKLGVIMLCAILLTGTLPVVGCSGATVAQDIVNWTPALESAVTTVDSTASILLPVDAPIFTAATVGFDAAATLLVAQAKAYLANPSASVLAKLQAAVVSLQQTVNASILSAAKITNTASQQHALAAINAVGTIVTAILAEVQSISGKAAVAQMASQSTIKLARIEPLRTGQDRAAEVVMLAAHYNLTPAQSARIATTGRAELMQTGF